MWKLRRYCKPYLKECILGPFFKFLEALFELIVPLIMLDIMENGIANGDKHYIVIRGIILLAMGVIGLGFSLTCQWFASKASQGFGRDLRHDVFQHISSMSYEDLNQFGESTLITKLTNDIYQAQNGLAMMIRLLVRSPFLVIGSIILALILDVKFGMVFLVIAPIVTIFLLVILSITSKKYKNIQKKLDGISLVSKENLEGTRVLRAFSKQEESENRFAALNDDFMQSNVKVGRIQALLNPCTYVLIQFGMIIILYWGQQRINDTGMSAEKIIAFINYMTQISIAVVAMANLFVLLTKANASASRIEDILSFVPESNTGALEEVSTNTNIAYSFKNVSFHYRGSEKNTLEDLNFNVKNGTTIGIIGGTGCGKTTLALLLAGFYNPTGGDLIFYGNPIQEYKKSYLKKCTSLVPQKASLLSGTIRSNLLFSNPEATEEDMIQALKLAQAYEFVQQKGLDATVEEGGKNFSGGQKQRLCIARALIKKNPYVLILDDSSSALDFKTEALLRQALYQEKKDVTKIIISQRCSSIASADQILVLNEGKIVGIGTQDELLKNCEIYQEIYDSQNKKKRGEENEKEE